MSDSILLRVRFDREIPDHSDLLPDVTEVFAEQLTQVLTGKHDDLAVDGPWGYGIAEVVAVEPYEEPDCTCDDVSACANCFAAAEEFVGKTVRDGDHVFVVKSVGEKDDWPILDGDRFWARPDDVVVVEPEPEDDWTPQYEPWRHGGWYVTNVRYPTGAVGCVSRNYPDGKWRIVCDDRPGEHTYPTRDAAARAERQLVAEGAIR